MASSLNQNGIVFPNNSFQISALPNNTIAIWGGQINTIPTGWQLCDGTNGTPDLRDRFIVGAGSSYSIGNTGGSNTVSLTEPQLPAHSHPASATVNNGGGHGHPAPGGTNTTGAHVHPIAMAQLAGTPLVPGAGRMGPVSATPSGGGHSHTISTSSTGDHSHIVTVTVNNEGSGVAHENRPPFYALAFIMEVA